MNCIDLSKLIDLSLLNKKEKDFYDNFIGVFDPGPNFIESDLYFGGMLNELRFE